MPQLLVQGNDVYRCDHVIRTGGRYDSHLLIPVTPEKGAQG